MRRYITTIALLLLTLHAFSQVPKREVRAVWLTTIGGIDWPRTRGEAQQKRELIQILDRLQAANVNTVLLQTRVRASTIYPSDYEPWDVCMTGRAGGNPGYDPLRFAVDECHRRGMELHAWVVTIPVGKWNNPACKQLRSRYPSLIKKIGDEGYMNPESSETGNYLAKICKEITDRYDIDGIHLDYIRYPEKWTFKVSRDQGRNYITDIVRKIHRAVKQSKPWVKVSCSPIGKFSDLSRYNSKGWNAYHTVCQDAQRWLREGLMDELFPMMYFRENNFYPFAIDWKERDYGRIVAPGLGIWFLDRHEGNWPLTDITRELQVLRQLNLGHTYFRSKFFTDNTKGIYNYVRDQFDQYPALVPAMTWEHSTPPSAPTRFGQKRHDDMVELRWDGSHDNSNGPYLLYNVYASRTTPVDVTDARNLIAARLVTNQLFLKSSGDDRPMYYAITAMDRYGNESAALQSNAIRGASRIPLLKNDGRRLFLTKDPSLDASVIIIESIVGNEVSRKPYTGETVDISRLPEGMYVVRGQNKNKVRHRIGEFIIKRGE